MYRYVTKPFGRKAKSSSIAEIYYRPFLGYLISLTQHTRFCACTEVQPQSTTLLEASQACSETIPAAVFIAA